MPLQLWKNPEFIRHCRSELRRSRAKTVGLVVLLLCALTILACWADQESRLVALQYSLSAQKNVSSASQEYVRKFAENLPKNTAHNAYEWLMLMQFGVISFWSLLSGAQAVSRERERGTWDFQRITRLTPAELLAGKLFGEPVLAYFIVLCCSPIALAAGLVGRIGAQYILLAYVLLFASAAFIGLAGLWLSSLFESKSRGIGLIAALVMFGMFLASQAFTESPFPGLAAFSPLTTLLPLIGRAYPSPRPTIFGGEMPWLLMALLLYVTFGGWLVLMLLRNLKRDFQEVRQLSRWQAVGCCAFLNFVLYALFNPTRQNTFQNASDFALFMVAINGFIFFFLGLTMLSSSERLDVGDLISPRSVFSDHGLQWPWLLISGVVSYLLLIWGLFAWEHVLEFTAGTLSRAAISFLIILIFVTRDVLFIQWCKLTRLRSPLLKGVLFLGPYYASVGVLCAVWSVTSERAAIAAGNVLTPAGAFNQSSALLPLSALCGIVVQLMAIAFLISAIRGRMRQTLFVAVAAD